LSFLSCRGRRSAEPRVAPRRSRRNLRKTAAIFWIPIALTGTAAHAADPKPETLTAFHRYVTAAEAQWNDPVGPDQFLFIDRLPDADRRSAYQQLQSGEVDIEEMYTEEDHHPIPIPGGLVHHWVGIIFIPRGTLAEVNAVLHDYDHQADIYKSDVRQARLIERNGENSKIFEQFYSKSIVTVVLNVYFDVAEKTLGNARAESVSRSTRIAEVADFGTPTEHERTDGKDYGYMWRLNSYWRLEEKDGGVYVQVESISLSRTVPVLLAWIVNPLTRSIPRDVLSRTLTNTRKAVQMLQAPRP
jgi:hypothetical protein